MPTSIILGSRIRFYRKEKKLSPGACLKIHSRHLYAPLCGILGPNSGYIAHYAPFIWPKSPTNCDAHLPESNFQTHSSSSSGGIRCLKVFYSIFLQTSTKIREEFATVQGVSERLQDFICPDHRSAESPETEMLLPERRNDPCGRSAVHSGKKASGGRASSGPGG